MSAVADDNNWDMGLKEMKCNIRCRRCGADPLRNAAGSVSSDAVVNWLRRSRLLSAGKGSLVALKNLLKSRPVPEKVIPRTRLQRLSVASTR